jgi:hypothetical protein
LVGSVSGCHAARACRRISQAAKAAGVGGVGQVAGGVLVAGVSEDEAGEHVVVDDRLPGGLVEQGLPVLDGGHPAEPGLAVVSCA